MNNWEINKQIKKCYLIINKEIIYYIIYTLYYILYIFLISLTRIIGIYKWKETSNIEKKSTNATSQNLL